MVLYYWDHRRTQNELLNLSWTKFEENLPKGNTLNK